MQQQERHQQEHLLHHNLAASLLRYLRTSCRRSGAPRGQREGVSVLPSSPLQPEAERKHPNTLLRAGGGASWCNMEAWRWNDFTWTSNQIHFIHEEKHHSQITSVQWNTSSGSTHTGSRCGWSRTTEREGTSCRLFVSNSTVWREKLASLHGARPELRHRDRRHVWTLYESSS